MAALDVCLATFSLKYKTAYMVLCIHEKLILVLILKLLKILSGGDSK